jgi:glycerol kinase
MDLLLQLQADQLQVPVTRARVAETTALGAAYLAGLAEGVWPSLEEIGSQWRSSGGARPALSRASADARYAQWRRAVQRAGGWERVGGSQGPGGREGPGG